MPRTAAVSVENNFIKGLITEATGLNFPENACTATNNCVFNIDGSVERRLGINFEAGFSTKAIDRTAAAISGFLWRNVDGDGTISLYVVQIGTIIYFWDTRSTQAASSGALSDNVDLTVHAAAGVTADQIKQVECQFTSGSKYLIVTHPLCTPFFVKFDSTTKTITETDIILKIRDFEGDVIDTSDVRFRPTTDHAGMDKHHAYNLYNQGWRDTELDQWDIGRTDMPSNVDVWWVYKAPQTNTVGSTATQVDVFWVPLIDSIEPGNSTAPKGHFIGTVWDFNREALTAAAVANTEKVTDLTGNGIPTTSSGQQRPSTCAFYSGRVFYAGINHSGFNSNIYFTQIIERDEQYGKCYQDNDPTAEELHDLLPSDGGIIKIPEAGTILKLFAMSGYLIAFATNGIWAITGSTGLGFVANDYVVQKISSIHAISACSFVDVGGYPAWWNNDGIFILSDPAAGGSMPQVKSLTFGSIKSYYDVIPTTSKHTARGFFNSTEATIQWIFRSQSAATPTETYAYDTILNYSIINQAWYPWDVAATNGVTINAIVTLDGTTGFSSTGQVVDHLNNTVIDNASNNVITFSFSSSGVSTPTFKYLVSYPTGGSYNFTFAEANDINYLDWRSLASPGTDFISFFLTGYKLRGQAIMKFSPLWVNIYSDTITGPSAYSFRGVWDYSLDPANFRWSQPQIISNDTEGYAARTSRLKVRGHGKALQFKVDSLTGLPFKLIGWSVFTTGNQLP